MMKGEILADREQSDFRGLRSQLASLRDEITREGLELLGAWGVGIEAGDYAPSALNLAHYVAMRRRDLCGLQPRLARYGLSSLGRSEADVLFALDAVIATLRRLCGEADVVYPPRLTTPPDENSSRAQARRLFGRNPDSPRTSIMATLPSEAATDELLVHQLLQAGMDCARINCAHDGPEAWAKMIVHIRSAEERLERSCSIMMDLAGPKCRVEAVFPPEKLRLHRGDRLALIANPDVAAKAPIAIQPTFPKVIDQLEIGAQVWINDGKIGARVISKHKGAVEIEVFSARRKGERLKVEKGLNFPTTDLRLSALTAKDFRDLDFVARHADIVGYSFVQEPSDVELLQDHLAARRGNRPRQPIVLKIETPLAVRNLPRLIIQSAQHNPTAVMIARGDLAVELGFARLAEIQEEILCLCDAAHVPVVWATQVLDQFVKEGVSNRAETTDAAMAQRAECVMLNKGPYLCEGIAFLRDVLIRMDRHHVKKFERLGLIDPFFRSAASENSFPNLPRPPNHRRLRLAAIVGAASKRNGFLGKW
jgi:pyruvate kinase